MRRTAVLLAALVVLAACGTDEATTSAQDPAGSASEEPDTDQRDEPSAKPPKPPKPSRTPEVPPDAPKCSVVWVDGTRLARDYAGCLAGQRFVEPDQESCSFGQRLVRFSDHFYAVRGGPVNRTAAPLPKDRVYRGALASCRA